MTDVQKALEIIDRLTPLIQSREKIPAGEAAGRILAEPIEAAGDFPPFDNSAMDGYAFLKKDLDEGKREFPVSFEIRPEDREPGTLAPGKCAYITTGSAIPPGADRVIPVEMIRKEGRNIVVENLPSKNPIRKKGEGYQKAEILIREGKYLTPADIGVLKGNGYRDVTVLTRTRVALQVTGNELDETRNTNGPVLRSWLERFPAVSVKEFPPLADEKGTMEERFKELLQQYDLVVTTGGVSAGAYDLVIPSFESNGVEFPVRGVRQKPGKPFSFGAKEGVMVASLPGNPVSAFFCAVLYLGRILKKRNHQPLTPGKALLANDYKSKEGRDEFVPAEFRFNGAERDVHTREGVQSHLLHHLSSANCFAWFEAGKQYRAGDPVTILPFHE